MPLKITAWKKIILPIYVLPDSNKVLVVWASQMFRINIEITKCCPSHINRIITDNSLPWIHQQYIILTLLNDSFYPYSSATLYYLSQSFTFKASSCPILPSGWNVIERIPADERTFMETLLQQRKQMFRTKNIHREKDH